VPCAMKISPDMMRSTLSICGAQAERRSNMWNSLLY
jgi:hypothetical protein